MVLKGGKANPLLKLEWNATQFLKELSALSGYSVGMAVVLNRWGDDSSKSGLFSKLMASKTRKLIQQSLIEGKPATGLPWEELDSKYQKWKAKNNYPDKIWSLGRNILPNINSTFQKTRGGYTVGLDKRKMIPRIQYGPSRVYGNPTKGKKISLETYASSIEYGQAHHHKARPLFSRAVLKAVQVDYPKLVHIVNRDIKLAIMDLAPGAIRKVGSSTQMDDTVGGASLAAARGQEAVRGIDVDIAILNSVNVAVALGDLDVTGSGNFDKDAYTANLKETKEMTKEWAGNNKVPTANPMTEDEIDKYLKDNGFM